MISTFPQQPSRHKTCYLAEVMSRNGKFLRDNTLDFCVGVGAGAGGGDLCGLLFFIEKYMYII